MNDTHAFIPPKIHYVQGQQMFNLIYTHGCDKPRIIDLHSRDCISNSKLRHSEWVHSASGRNVNFASIILASSSVFVHCSSMGEYKHSRIPPDFATCNTDRLLQTTDSQCTSASSQTQDSPAAQAVEGYCCPPGMNPASILVAIEPVHSICFASIFIAITG